MIKVIRNIAGTIALILAVYSLSTQNFKFEHIMMLSTSVFGGAAGLMELKRKPKSFGGYFNIVISVFIFFVLIQRFLNNPNML